uniref:Uncharacterized protein n=1 Tax=viral metagenome TaxID=1070528 RepID=A0A6C0JMU9_9ZZZZ
MSKSNASAKNRRAFGGNPPSQTPIQTQNAQPNSQQQGFTLQQVIEVIDRRLLNLEGFMKETKDNNERHVHFENMQSTNMTETESESPSNNIDDVLNEFNNRFELIAQEIGELKDIVLKLQSYTMDVNKTLLEERVRVFSDLGSVSNALDNQVFEITNDQVTNHESNSVDLKNLVKEEFSQS